MEGGGGAARQQLLAGTAMSSSGQFSAPAEETRRTGRPKDDAVAGGNVGNSGGGDGGVSGGVDFVRCVRCEGMQV